MNPAELAARTLAAPRPTADIATDLADAATRLRALAGGIRLGGPTPEALADADRTVTGCSALLQELRRGLANPREALERRSDGP